MSAKAPRPPWVQTSGRRGFTLTEPLVAIGIIDMLAPISSPVFARAWERACQATGVSNLKQIATAWLMYAQVYDELARPSYYYSLDFRYDYARDCILGWSAGATPSPDYGFLSYPRSHVLNKCPSLHGNAWGRPHTGYAYNANNIGGDNFAGLPFANLAAIQSPFDTLLLAEGGFGNPVAAQDYVRAPSDPLYIASKVHFRHDGGAVTACADSYAKVAKLKFRRQTSEPECGALSNDDSVYLH